MAHFSAVSDEDLARARRDPAFRRKLLSESLEVLLAMHQSSRERRESFLSRRIVFRAGTKQDSQSHQRRFSIQQDRIV